MKISTKRILMPLFLAAGIAWDCLCMLNILPLSLFAVSAAAVGGYAFIIIFAPLLFAGGTQATEKSAYAHGLTKREKQMSYATVCLAALWTATLVACIVYPI